MNSVSRIRKNVNSGASYLCNTMLLLLIAFNPSAHAYSDISTNSENWQFRVYLDDDEIGFHHFSLVNKGDYSEIISKARFDVNFLFFNAYSYRHDNVERWNGNCLETINAVTNDNGEEYKVTGTQTEEAFIVNTINKQQSHPACIKTFAYWDPGFLQEKTLLNSQTGEMIEVQSRFIGNETLSHNGEFVDARRYRLSGDGIQIDLWYSADDQWLALESLTEGGRIVRYAMPDLPNRTNR